MIENKAGWIMPFCNRHRGESDDRQSRLILLTPPEALDAQIPVCRLKIFGGG
jgi:hypothetical protein